MVSWKGILIGLMLVCASLAHADVRRASEPVLNETRKKSLASYAKQLGTPAGVSTTDSVFLSIQTDGAKVDILAIAPAGVDREKLAQVLDQWGENQGLEGDTQWDLEAAHFLHSTKQIGAQSTKKSLDLESLRLAFGDDSSTIIGRVSVHKAATHTMQRPPDWTARNIYAWRLPRGQKWDQFEAGFTLPIYAPALIAFAALWMIVAPLLVRGFGLWRAGDASVDPSKRADLLMRLIKYLPGISIGLHAPVFALLMLDETLPRIMMLWFEGPITGRAIPFLIAGIVSVFIAVRTLEKKAVSLREQASSGEGTSPDSFESLGWRDFEKRPSPQPWRRRMPGLPTLAGLVVLGVLGTSSSFTPLILGLGVAGLLWIFLAKGYDYHWKFGLEESARMELDMQEFADLEARKLGVPPPAAVLDTRIEWTARYAEIGINSETGASELRFGTLFTNPVSEGEKRFLVHRELCQAQDIVGNKRVAQAAYLWLIPAILVPVVAAVLIGLPTFRYPLGVMMLLTIASTSVVPKWQEALKRKRVLRADQEAFRSFDAPEDARSFFRNGLLDETQPEAITVPRHALFGPRVAALKKAGLL